MAPPKLERPPGDRVKTDRRDARRLARLLHIGEVTGKMHMTSTVPPAGAPDEPVRRRIRCRFPGVSPNGHPWCSEQVKVPRRRVSNLSEALIWAAERGARTVLFDVEPLLAAWNTDAEQLRRGVQQVVDAATALPRVEVMGFTTNSLRRLDSLIGESYPLVFYWAAARKPLTVKPYRELPQPGVVVGDQIATDGALAWRLGHACAHVMHDPVRVPWGTSVMRLLGSPLADLLFVADPPVRS